MARQQPASLRQRVTEAAEAVLNQKGSVGPLELLQQLLFLHPVHVKGWRQGNPHLTPIEAHIQCGPKKLQQVYEIFQDWVRANGLQPLEVGYTRNGVHGPEPLQVSDDPSRERFFARYYVPAGMPAAKVAAMAESIWQCYPNCPAGEARQIASHTACRGSGRVGRTAAGGSLDPAALDLAVIAWIRHHHTRYDSLLTRGTDRAEARLEIRDRIDEVLSNWSGG